MAYLDVAARFDTAHQPALFAPALAQSETETEFTPLQWRVIELSRKDSLASLREETRFGEFLRFVFGLEPKRPLADARLEALRRMAVMSWHHGYNVYPGELEAFLNAGYSIDHYEALMGHIGEARAASGRRAAP